jgi:hypothetical protein
MCNPHSYGQTNVANVYIAGNITDHPTHFVISAAAEGAKVAFAINSSILKRDTAQEKIKSFSTNVVALILSLFL